MRSLERKANEQCYHRWKVSKEEECCEVVFEVCEQRAMANVLMVMSAGIGVKVSCGSECYDYAKQCECDRITWRCSCL